MIKQFLKLMAIAILFFSRIETVANAQKLTHRCNPIAQVKQLEQEAAQLNLVLPYVAEVILKSDGPEAQSKSGRLINIDHKNKQIQLEIADKTEFINIANIEQILFRGYVVLNQRRIVIRGDENITLIPVIEKLSNFQLVNPRNGEATLQLTSMQSNPEDFSQDAYYIVREISFESPDTINIKYKIQP